MHVCGMHNTASCPSSLVHRTYQTSHKNKHSHLIKAHEFTIAVLLIYSACGIISRSGMLHGLHVDPETKTFSHGGVICLVPPNIPRKLVFLAHPWSRLIWCSLGWWCAPVTYPCYQSFDNVLHYYVVSLIMVIDACWVSCSALCRRSGYNFRLVVDVDMVFEAIYKHR